MKQKDLMYLILAVVILLVAGYVIYSQIMPKSTAQTGVKVDVVGQIQSSIDSSVITPSDKTKDFSSPVDYNGLNNTAPFGK